MVTPQKFLKNVFKKDKIQKDQKVQYEKRRISIKFINE